MRRRKKYITSRDPITGKRASAHRLIAQQLLGRPLLPREVVHHRDGDSTNNSPENLLVLPSQRCHAHLEFHLRRERLGMPSLFPELFEGFRGHPAGSLFHSVLVSPIHEPPLPVRRLAPVEDVTPSLPLLLNPSTPYKVTGTLTLWPDEREGTGETGRLLGDLLRQIGVEIRWGGLLALLPLIPLEAVPPEAEKSPS